MKNTNHDMDGAPHSAAIDDDSKRQAELAQLSAKWNIFNPDKLKQRCEQTGQHRYLIDPIIPTNFLGLMIGDSGLGKSPLAYQIGICVAAGLPLLGMSVTQARVLYLDFEDGSWDVHNLISKLSTYLGLQDPPRDLFLWNINDCKPNWQGRDDALRLIRDVKPGLVFIDPVSTLYPEIEKSNPEATEVYQKFRKVMRDCGCSIFNLHHPKKDATLTTPISLEDDHYRGWFQKARGASVLANGADIRIGVDRPGLSGVKNSEIALVLRGYGRIRGEIPTIYLARDRDGDGEPMGYRKVTGVGLLNNPEQEQALMRLPDQFRFKDAKLAYGKADEATNLFLRKCIATGILRKLGRGQYEKVKAPE